ncbi:MAG: tetratricopeptide repeat protein [Planctomycetes bacterium]|nr:tetratricopeptide repeat protein [Planctomycetota bacterium]
MSGTKVAGRLALLVIVGATGARAQQAGVLERLEGETAALRHEVRGLAEQMKALGARLDALAGAPAPAGPPQRPAAGPAVRGTATPEELAAQLHAAAKDDGLGALVGLLIDPGQPRRGPPSRREVLDALAAYEPRSGALLLPRAEWEALTGSAAAPMRGELDAVLEALAPVLQGSRLLGVEALAPATTGQATPSRRLGLVLQGAGEAVELVDAKLGTPAAPLRPYVRGSGAYKVTIQSIRARGVDRPIYAPADVEAILGAAEPGDRLVVVLHDRGDGRDGEVELVVPPGFSAPALRPLALTIAPRAGEPWRLELTALRLEGRWLAVSARSEWFAANARRALKELEPLLGDLEKQSPRERTQEAARQLQLRGVVAEAKGDLLLSLPGYLLRLHRPLAAEPTLPGLPALPTASEAHRRPSLAERLRGGADPAARARLCDEAIAADDDVGLAHLERGRARWLLARRRVLEDDGAHLADLLTPAVEDLVRAERALAGREQARARFVLAGLYRAMEQAGTASSVLRRDQPLGVAIDALASGRVLVTFEEAAQGPLADLALPWRVRAALLQGKYGEAQLEARRLIALAEQAGDPVTFAEAQGLLGEACWRAGRRAEALAAVDEALRHDPTEPRARALRAALRVERPTPEALDGLEPELALARRLEPGEPLADHVRASLRLAAGDLAGARRAADEGATMRGRIEPQLHLVGVTAALAEGDAAGAAERLRRCDPQPHPVFYLLRGRLLLLGALPDTITEPLRQAERDLRVALDRRELLTPEQVRAAEEGLTEVERRRKADASRRRD